MAKGYATEAANAVCAESIQIHGGVGFTWDCDAHLFYRRAKQDDLLLGAGSWHRHRLADMLLGG
jgi:alkylation response protein AidB-like acyl-CoA dehydrogenase